MLQQCAYNFIVFGFIYAHCTYTHRDICHGLSLQCVYIVSHVAIVLHKNAWTHTHNQLFSYIVMVMHHTQIQTWAREYLNAC